MSDLYKTDDWSYLPLKDVVHVILGQSPESSSYNETGEGLPFFQGKTEFRDIYPIIRKWCSDPKKIAEEDDILLSVRAPVGPTNLAPTKCAIGRGLAALRPKNGYDVKYFLYLMRRYQGDLVALGTGTTFAAISGDVLKSFIVPVAPIYQQKQIVAKIEELFSHIDAGIVALQKAKQLLKQYRQSVLKVAVTGELTREWREQNKDRLEPASELLQRILAERRRKWEEQQLEQFRMQGKVPKDDNWKEKIKAPSLITDEEILKLDKIPSNWIYLNLGNLIEEPKYGTSKKCTYGFNENRSGVLRIPNIANGMIDAADLKYAEFDEQELENYKLVGGDILTIRSNGSISLVGKCAIVKEVDTKYLYAGYLINLRPIKVTLNSEYFHICLSSPLVREQIESKAKSTSGVNNINSGELQSLILPICCLEEQELIAKTSSEKLSIADRLDNQINIQISKAEQNKQSILAAAFSGKL